jgi:hypothetical protein
LWVLPAWLRGGTAPPPPSGTAKPNLEQASEKNTVYRVAGRAGKMRAIAHSMPPHVFPRQSRRRPTPRFYSAGEVIDFALVAVYGIKMALFAPGSGLRRVFFCCGA